LRFLRAKANRAAASGGNADSGRAIFAGKGNCTSCHRIDVVGARTGPDLSDIGRIRHSIDIERSILEPDFYIIPSNRFVRLVTRDGVTMTGRLLNHDNFTVQVLDTKSSCGRCNEPTCASSVSWKNRRCHPQQLHSYSPRKDSRIRTRT
jgi:putative heme-binding domain-containing protein